MTITATTMSYCQSCHRDFEDGELVWWAVWDGSILCDRCLSESTIIEKEPRVYKQDLSD